MPPPDPSPTRSPFSEAESAAVGVTVEDLSKQFGTFEVLKNVTFAVEPGEIFVLMGPSGSGKSVLLKHIVGLELLTSGRVTITCDATHSSLGVFRGMNLAQLDLAAAVGPSAEQALQLEFDALAGEDYSIAFQSQGSAMVRLSLVLDARELRGPRWVSPGLFAFDLHTTFERSWTVEATTNLVDWVPIVSQRGIRDTLEFLDPAALDHPRRFYRAVAEW